MKKLLILCLMIFIIPIGVNAYEIEEELRLSWGGSGNDKLQKYLETSDGHYIIAGTSTSTDIEGLGNNGREDLVIIKYDQNKNIVWQKNWGGNREEFIMDFVETSDGGIVIAGECYSTNIDGITNKGGGDGLILKLDKDGNEVWKHNWGGSLEDYFSTIIMTEDEEFIVTGYFRSPTGEGLTSYGAQDMIIIKYDKNGNMLWQKQWGGDQFDTLNSPILTEDGGLILVGTTPSTNIEGLTNKGGQDAVIIKYDKDGNLVWQKNWGGNGSDSFNSPTLTKDGHIVVLASSGSTDLNGLQINGSSDFIVLKYDLDGNLVWQKSWGGNDSETGRKMFYVEDEGYIIFGQSTSTDIEGLPNKGKGDFLFIKLDLNGNLVWKNGWGGNGLDQVLGAFEVAKGKYIICGNSWSTDIENVNNEQYIDMIWITCDKNGNIFEKKFWYEETGMMISPSHTTKNGDILATVVSNKSIDNIQNKGSNDTIFFKYKLSYNINVDKTENGSTNITKQNELATIKPTPNKGYIVDKIIVKDTSGNEIETKQEKDGTYTFNLCDDVDIKVLYKEITNPKTGNILSYLELLFLIIFLIGAPLIIRKKQLRNS